jgi:ribosomal protein L4
MNSLYELAQLDDKDFKTVIQKKNTLRALTSAEISKLNQSKSKKHRNTVLVDEPRKSKTKFINDFAKDLLLEHQYQIEKIEIRYDPKNSLMPAKAPKVVIVKGSDRNGRK